MNQWYTDNMLSEMVFMYMLRIRYILYVYVSGRLLKMPCGASTHPDPREKMECHCDESQQGSVGCCWTTALLRELPVFQCREVLCYPSKVITTIPVFVSLCKYEVFCMFGVVLVFVSACCSGFPEYKVEHSSRDQVSYRYRQLEI